MKLQWIGGPTFLLKLGRFKFLSDPMFGEGMSAFVMFDHPSTGEGRTEIAPLSPLPEVNMDGLDCILVSHLHTDHFDVVASHRLPKQLLLFAPSDQVSILRDRGFENVVGLAWWQETVMEKNGERLKITGVPARHAHDREVNESLGIVNGYIVEHVRGDQSYKVHWTGDTVLFDGLSEIKERIEHTHLLIPHLGAQSGLMNLTA